MIVLCTGCRSGFVRPAHRRHLVPRLLHDPSPRLRHLIGPGVRARLWARRVLGFEGVEKLVALVVGS
jgi:hypothetical protein